MWCSSLDLKMNAQPFRLPPAIYGKCRLKFLQVGVWTHGWLRVNADDLKSKQRDGLTRSHIGKLACERKRKHKRVLDKESAEVKRKVAIATSAPRMSTQVCLRQKKPSSLRKYFTVMRQWSDLRPPFFMSWVRRSRKWGFPWCVAYVRSGRKWISGPENAAGSLENRCVSE